MRVKPEMFRVGEKVLYFSPRKYQGYQDKWLRKFSGPFEVIKILGPVNVVLRKMAKSTPFTTHIDKLRKIETDLESAQHLTATEPDAITATANAYIDKEAVKMSRNKSEGTSRRENDVESEAEDSYASPVSIFNVPVVQNNEEDGSQRPRRVRTLPVRYRQ